MVGPAPDRSLSRFLGIEDRRLCSVFAARLPGASVANDRHLQIRKPWMEPPLSNLVPAKPRAPAPFTFTRSESSPQPIRCCRAPQACPSNFPHPSNRPKLARPPPLAPFNSPKHQQRARLDLRPCSIISQTRQILRPADRGLAPFAHRRSQTSSSSLLSFIPSRALSANSDKMDLLALLVANRACRPLL